MKKVFLFFKLIQIFQVDYNQFNQVLILKLKNKLKKIK